MRKDLKKGRLSFSYGNNKDDPLGKAVYRSDSMYCKTRKFSDTQQIAVVILKIWIWWFNNRRMGPNDADWMANSVDPDKTAPLGAVWSGSTLFAQAYLSKKSVEPDQTASAKC